MCLFIALTRKLMLRRSVNELVDAGIYPCKLFLQFQIFCADHCPCNHVLRIEMATGRFE